MKAPPKIFIVVCFLVVFVILARLGYHLDNNTRDDFGPKRAGKVVETTEPIKHSLTLQPDIHYRVAEVEIATPKYAYQYQVNVPDSVNKGDWLNAWVDDNGGGSYIEGSYDNRWDLMESPFVSGIEILGVSVLVAGFLTALLAIFFSAVKEYWPRLRKKLV